MLKRYIPSGAGFVASTLKDIQLRQTHRKTIENKRQYDKLNRS
jgi:hypothetical protein